MPTFTDAAQDFLEHLRRLFPDKPEEFVRIWERFYRENFPELYRKQVEDYRAAGEDWKEIVRKRNYPRLLEKLPAIEAAHRTLPAVWARVLRRAEEVLGFREEVPAVVHVGIGCGAGWATDYGGRPAVLFGLENIAELGWHLPERLEGLAAHELGHVIHRFWRGEDLEQIEKDPAGLLYTEGFAQRLEGLVLGGESFHQAPDPEWTKRSREGLPGIAKEYLARLDGGDVREFFGSWFDFRGIKYSGYFLGYRLIRCLEERESLQAIAALSREGIEREVRSFLRRVARQRR